MSLRASPGSSALGSESIGILTSPALKPFISSANAVSKEEVEYAREMKTAEAAIQALTSQPSHTTTDAFHHQADTTEALTNLRIRVAVLENELKHARQDKENVMNSLGVIIDVLACRRIADVPVATHKALSTNPSTTGAAHGTVHGSSKDDVKVLEKEVSRLRKENKSLNNKLKKESEEEITQVLADVLDDVVIRRGYAHNIKGEVEAKEKGVIRDTRSPGPTPTDLAGSWGISQSRAQGDSFASNATTIPNSPPLKHTLTANVQAASGKGNTDVGMHSLEESFETFESDSSLPAPATISVEQAQANLDSWAQTELGDIASFDDERDIDEQIEDQRKAMEKFNALPVPAVKKVNTEVQGSVRGKEYDPSNVPTPPRALRSMRDFNRFTAPLQKRSSTLDILHENGGDESASGLKFPNLLWDTRGELSYFVDLQGQICGRSRDETRFPDLFRYGLQFIPGETDSNYMRTVMISNIPSSTTLRDVLARVRGGEVLSATLLNTIPITGSWSARVVFKHEAAADEYVSWAAAHPITFSSDEPAAVTLISTPTYPLSPRLSLNLLRHGKTRCFCIPSFPPFFSIRTLERNFACGNGFRAQSLIETYLDEQGTLHLEFSDVDLACRAAVIVSARQSYEGCVVVWESDPCAGPLEELLEEPKPRPPMIPRHSPSSLVGNDNGDSSDTSNGANVVNQAQQMQRQRLAAVTSRKVEIPSFGSDRLRNSSWADEVNEEIASSSNGQPHSERQSGLHPTSSPESSLPALDGPPNSPTVVGGAMGMVSIDAVLARSMSHLGSDKEINTTINNSNLESSFIGLAGSKYATHIPSFSHSGSHPRFGRSFAEREGIRSPPRTKLEDLIGESETETETEGEGDMKLGAGKGKIDGAGGSITGEDGAGGKAHVEGQGINGSLNPDELSLDDK